MSGGAKQLVQHRRQRQGGGSAEAQEKDVGELWQAKKATHVGEAAARAGAAAAGAAQPGLAYPY